MNLKVIAAVVAGLVSTAPAVASQITLDFEGVSSFQSIDGYYNGGTDGGGLSGPNVGVLFGGDALAAANDVLGPYFSNAPTPGSILAPVGADAALNYSAGFINTASFFYSSSAATTVSIFSDLNGQGTLLGTFNLTANAQDGCTDTPLCHWTQTSLGFAGVARSIQFGSAAGLAGFDNVSIAPVPLPAAAWLLLSGLGGLASLGRRKRTA